MRFVVPLALLGVMTTCNADAIQDSQYVETNKLRKDLVDAQRAWHLTHPDLEAYILTKPKSQVLREIDDAESAAKRFTSLQRQYYERRYEEFSKQTATLQPGGTAGDSNTLASQMKSMVNRQMDSLEADQQALQARLDELNKPGAQLTAEEVLIHDRLTKEVQEIERMHFELSRQSKEIPKPRPGEDLETIRHRLLDFYSQLAQSANSQRTLAGQEERLVGSYYGNLRAAVEKRPDDAPAQPLRTTGDTGEVTLPAPKYGAPMSDSLPGPQGAAPSTHFKGVFVRPATEATLPCKIKSADLTIDVEEPSKKLSGTLVVNSSACPADESSHAVKSPLNLKFSGITAKGKTADLKCSGGAKATITFEFTEENKATVDLKPLSPNWGKEVFVRIAVEKTSHQDTPADGQSTAGKKDDPPKKGDATKKQ